LQGAGQARKRAAGRRDVATGMKKHCLRGNIFPAKQKFLRALFVRGGKSYKAEFG
jgi:hypothetical protein